MDPQLEQTRRTLSPGFKRARLNCLNCLSIAKFGRNGMLRFENGFSTISGSAASTAASGTPGRGPACLSNCARGGATFLWWRIQEGSWPSRRHWGADRQILRQSKIHPLAAAEIFADPAEDRRHDAAQHLGLHN